jgi:prolyl oligopeptidase
MRADPIVKTSLAAALAAICVVPLTALAAATLPETPKRPVENTYQGQVVRDDYRWLEDDHDPKVRGWSDAENAVAREFLDAIPERKDILKRVNDLTNSRTPRYFGLVIRGGTTFAIKDQPPLQQPLLVALGSVDDTTSERVIVDPNRLDPSGSTAIDFYVPSLDGSKVAVSLSKGGTEDGTVYVYDAANGTRLSDEVPHVNGGTAGGSVSWNADGSGFWRTRYPAEGERKAADLPFYQQVYFHRLGDPASADTYVIGKEFPKIAEIALETSDDGKYVLANVFNGDGGDHAFYIAKTGGLAGADGKFRQISRFEDRVVKAEFGDDALYLLSRAGAPNGKLLRLALPDGKLGAARVVVPAGKVAIESFLPAGNRLYVEDMVGGPSDIRIFTALGRPAGTVALPPISSIGGMVKVAGDVALIRTESYTEPARWWRYDPKVGKLAPTALVQRSPATFAGVEVTRVFATSKDGTKVPINLMYRKGTKLDGTAPTLLYGYGGYGISETPAFSPARQLWIEQGGIYALAGIRGGGEYGDAWHRAGNLTKKQNVFDDFAASAKYLIDHKYTNANKLAFRGGSNGGLLMGAMITQHPDLAKSVVCQVGVLDMLRVEFSPNGEFNITEFGTVKDPAQFKAMYAYSPYHHVVEGTKYPAVLFMTGANDPRVEPANSRKMAARMQAANASGAPILLRTSSGTGHGIGSPLSARNEEAADWYSFVFKTLEVPYQPVTAPLP